MSAPELPPRLSMNNPIKSRPKASSVQPSPRSSSKIPPLRPRSSFPPSVPPPFPFLSTSTGVIPSPTSSTPFTPGTPPGPTPTSNSSSSDVLSPVDMGECTLDVNSISGRADPNTTDLQPMMDLSGINISTTPNLGTPPTGDREMSFPWEFDRRNLLQEEKEVDELWNKFDVSPSPPQPMLSQAIRMSSEQPENGFASDFLPSDQGTGSLESFSSVVRANRSAAKNSSGPYPGGVVTLKLERKHRKNTREKQRRQELNEKFDTLSNLLHLGRKSKAEKFTILSEAINLINSLRHENAALKKEKTNLYKALQTVMYTTPPTGGH